MSKGIVDTVIGGAEIAAGAVLIATGVGAPFGAALIVAGAGEVMTGIAEMLAKQPGQGVATTNPVGPYTYLYGTMKTPGVEIFSETNSKTGTSTTSNDKQWHRVFALACHPTDSLVEVRLDGQVLNLVQQPSSDPNTTIWQSASPHQTTCNIASISRSGGIVTMKVSGGYAATFNGQTMVVSGVRDNTYNGVWTMWLPNPADLTTWQYQCGGADGSSSGGRCETCIPDYSNKIHVEFQNGNQTKTFPTLLAAQNGSTSSLTWLPTDVCYGHTVVYIQMGYDSAYFPSYPTNMSFVVKGKNDILDPRTGQRGYTENAALCIADYMAQPRLRGGFGLAIGSTIDQNNLIAAANTCDETLTLAVGGTVPQYSCNTNFDLNTPRGTNIQRMLSACAGRLSVQGGVWSIIPGAYVAPSLYLNEKNVVGPIKLDTRLSVMEACNAVKGTFVSPANNYQPSDYPLYQQDTLHGFVTNTWLVEDGNEIIVHNLDLPCTNISAVAQRLAKIQLMRQRYQYRLHLQCDLTAYQATVGDVIGLSLARYNWVNEPFEVLHVGLAYDDNGKPVVELDLAQVDGASSAANSAIYTWSPTEELTITDSIVPNNVGVRVCSAPENVIAYSGTGGTVNGVVCPSTIIIHADGTETSSIYVEWTQPNDANVVNGGHIEVQWQPVGATSWTSLGKVDPSVNSAWINNVSFQGQYNVQVRAVNAANVPSAWIAAVPTPVTVTTDVPQQVTNVAATESPVNVNGVVMSVVEVGFTPAAGDTAFDHVEVYFSGYQGNQNPQLMASGNTSPIQFNATTTFEVVMVTVVAVSKTNVAAPFASAPSVPLALDGQVSAPLGPTIYLDQTALPGNTGWQFSFNITGGLEADQIACYRVYHSETTDLAVGSSYFQTVPQPMTGTGWHTVQETTHDLLYYWVSAVNTAGLESTLTPVPFTFVDPNNPAPSQPAPVQTTKAFSPTTSLNGWAKGVHVGFWETQNSDNGTNFGISSSQVANPFSSPSSAYDGNQTTAASYSDTHHASYAGCVWSFSNFAGLQSGATVVSATLSILSAVTPTSGPVHGEGSIYYSLDGGNTWTQVYLATYQNGGNANRPKQTDTINVPVGQDFTKLQVMACAHSHDDLAMSVYEITLSVTQSAPAGPQPVTGVTAALDSSTGNVKITWNALTPTNRTDIISYEVTRGVKGSDYAHSYTQTTIPFVSGQATYSWEDPQCHDGTFIYWIVVNNSTGWSAPSSPAAGLSGSASMVYSNGQTVEALKPAAPGADVTSQNIARDTAKVNGIASASISPIAGLMPAQAGADKTSSNTAADTSAVNGRASSDVSNTVVSGGGIDFGSGLHRNKALDNIGDGSSYVRVPTTIYGSSGNAIDQLGNLKLKNTKGIGGVTASPTVSSSFADLPELGSGNSAMTMSLKGNPCLVGANLNFNAMSSGGSVGGVTSIGWSPYQFSIAANSDHSPVNPPTISISITGNGTGAGAGVSWSLQGNGGPPTQYTYTPTLSISPGSGYTSATATVTISNAPSGSGLSNGTFTYGCTVLLSTPKVGVPVEIQILMDGVVALGPFATSTDSNGNAVFNLLQLLFPTAGSHSFRVQAEQLGSGATVTSGSRAFQIVELG